MSEFKYNFKSDVMLSKIGLHYKIPIIRFTHLSRYKDILHFITTRHGGYSQKPFNSFNLASHVGDREDHVFKNRDLLANSLNITSRNFFYTHQEHGDKVFLINNRNIENKNNELANIVPTSDAIITADKGICLLIFVADCVPVLLFDCRKKVIGAVHAGWKGTASQISHKTIHLMQSYYGCKPHDIKCAIGPSIGPCCYQVGKEVIDRVKRSFSEKEQLALSDPDGDKSFFNLWYANKMQLLNCGIPEENIEMANLCTFCYSDLFFSSRKEDKHTGRFAAGIMLK